MRARPLAELANALTPVPWRSHRFRIHARRDALTLGKLIDRYEALRTKEGERIKSLPAAMRQLHLGSLKPGSTCPAAQF